MALKPNGADFVIKEQIIEDLASGLTLQFEYNPDDVACPYRLKIYGEALPFGNREILFTPDGKEGAAGTLVSGSCQASWIKAV